MNVKLPDQFAHRLLALDGRQGHFALHTEIYFLRGFLLMPSPIIGIMRRLGKFTFIPTVQMVRAISVWH